MRLIDADALVEYKVTGEIDNLSGDFVPGFAIAMAPTIDAEPVRHGRWIKEKLIGHEPYYLCSLCGKLHYQNYNFCNNCGAKMDKGVQND